MAYKVEVYTRNDIINITTEAFQEITKAIYEAGVQGKEFPYDFTFEEIFATIIDKSEDN